MEISNIYFSDNVISVTINDPEQQVEHVIEMNAGDFFDKIASAFYSMQAKNIDAK